METQSYPYPSSKTDSDTPPSGHRKPLLVSGRSVPYWYLKVALLAFCVTTRYTEVSIKRYFRIQTKLYSNLRKKDHQGRPHFTVTTCRRRKERNERSRCLCCTVTRERAKFHYVPVV